MASIFKQQYTAKGENGKRIKKKSAYWYIDYRGPDGVRKRVKGFKDKTATAQLAAKLEKESELAQAGIVDRFKAHRLTPLSQHLLDFEQSLLAGGVLAEYAQQQHDRIKRVFDSNGFVFMG